MVIQAGAARRIVEQDPSRAAGVARVIKQMSREALDEMRRLVGVMTPDGEAAALAPQPTMQHVDSLVIRARAAGLKVDLTIDGERPELPPGIDVSAYRVVQEALMNTIKYAPSARARVQVRYGDAGVEVDVSDDGAGAQPAAGGADSLSGGQGLLGMRERVTLYGGDFESGPGDAGGFHVRARFPLVERVPA
jgi:signal transduction histidine kinase